MFKATLELSDLAKKIKIGTYQHFKGGMYKVLGIGRNSENNEEELVVYQSLENGNIWIRPVPMFLDNVERDNYKGPRFKFIKE